MTEFKVEYITDEDCVDCNENATKLLQAVDESIDLMEKFAADMSGVDAQDILKNNVIEVRDENGELIAAVHQEALDQLLTSYRKTGLYNMRKWSYTRVFSHSEVIAENLPDQRENVLNYEQSGSANPQPTPEQSGVSEEGDSLPEEGLFRLDLNEDLLRQHSELCPELRGDSDEGDPQG